MINKPPPFKGLNIRIPIIIPVRGRGFINRRLGLSYRLRYGAGPWPTTHEAKLADPFRRTLVFSIKVSTAADRMKFEDQDRQTSHFFSPEPSVPNDLNSNP